MSNKTKTIMYGKNAPHGVWVGSCLWWNSSDEQFDPAVAVCLDGAMLGSPSFGDDLDMIFRYSSFLHQLRDMLCA